MEPRVDEARIEQHQNFPYQIADCQSASLMQSREQGENRRWTGATDHESLDGKQYTTTILNFLSHPQVLIIRRFFFSVLSAVAAPI